MASGLFPTSHHPLRFGLSEIDNFKKVRKHIWKIVKRGFGYDLMLKVTDQVTDRVTAGVLVSNIGFKDADDMTDPSGP